MFHKAQLSNKYLLPHSNFATTIDMHSPIDSYSFKNREAHWMGLWSNVGGLLTNVNQYTGRNMGKKAHQAPQFMINSVVAF